MIPYQTIVLTSFHMAGGPPIDRNMKDRRIAYINESLYEDGIFDIKRSFEHPMDICHTDGLKHWCFCDCSETTNLTKHLNKMYKMTSDEIKDYLKTNICAKDEIVEGLCGIIIEFNKVFNKDYKQENPYLEETNKLICMCLMNAKCEEKCITFYEYLIDVLNIDNESNVSYIVMEYLSKLQYIEHGSAIRCSYITKLGKKFLDEQYKVE